MRYANLVRITENTDAADYTEGLGPDELDPSV